MSYLPPAFRREVQQRWPNGQMDDSTAQYYLMTFNRADSTTVPGQNGRPSVMGDALLNEDAREYTTLYTAIETGQGWRPEVEIGEGTYGSVVLWECPLADGTVMRVAIKEAACSSFFRDYCAEASLTRRLNEAGCRNVIGVVEWAFVAANGCMQTHPKHRIAYEFAEGLDLASLYNWYQRQGLIFPEPFIWHVLCSISNALCFCRHGHASLPGRPGWDSIVHGDIKCENILITAPDQVEQYEGYPLIKLADFGLAYTLGASVTSVQHFVTSQAYGTTGYMAPEIADRTPEREGRRRRPHELYGPHSDIYSLGMTCKKMLDLVEFGVAGPGPNAIGPLFDLARTMDLRQSYSPELRNLLDRCVAPDPRDRPKTFPLFAEASATMGRMLELGFESSKDGEGRLRPYHSLVLFTRQDKQRWTNDQEFRQAYMYGNLGGLVSMIRGEEARRNAA